MEEVNQFKEATENSFDVLNDPQPSCKCAENMYYMYYISSWKYIENMYYMSIQLSPLSLNPFFLVSC